MITMIFPPPGPTPAEIKEAQAASKIRKKLEAEQTLKAEEAKEEKERADRRERHAKQAEYIEAHS